MFGVLSKQPMKTIEIKLSPTEFSLIQQALRDRQSKENIIAIVSGLGFDKANKEAMDLQNWLEQQRVEQIVD